MLSRILIYATILGFLGLASGCAVEEFQEPMGYSVRQAIQAQRLAAVPPSTEPVEGLDGVKVQGIVNEYRKPPESDSGQQKDSGMGLKLDSGSGSNKK